MILQSSLTWSFFFFSPTIFKEEYHIWANQDLFEDIFLYYLKGVAKALVLLACRIPDVQITKSWIWEIISGAVGASAEEGYKNDEKAGALLLWGKAEVVELV